jgi:SAM-dependent methyltransferase
MENPHLAAHTKIYDSVANEYKERLIKARQIKKETTQLLLNYLKPGDLVLDLGCAIGYDTKMLSRKCSVVGIDISEEMIKKARSQNKGNRKVTIIHGDFLSMKFDRKFDGIFANAFIHLFPTSIDAKVFKKIRTSLGAGGVAYISTTISKRLKEGWYTKKGYSSKEKRFRKFWTKKALTKLITDSDFKIVNQFDLKDPFGNHLMNFIIQK